MRTHISNFREIKKARQRRAFSVWLGWRFIDEIEGKQSKRAIRMHPRWAAEQRAIEIEVRSVSLRYRGLKPQNIIEVNGSENQVKST
jgi:hypothetical protein